MTSSGCSRDATIKRSGKILTYTAIVYWVFRGKVKLGKFSY